MEKLRKMIPYLLINIGIFYLMPILMKNTGSAILIMLFLIPLACFITSIAYGQKNSFYWLYPILVMLVFIPSIFIFYNESAFIYIFIYGIISGLGSFIGDKIGRENNRGV